MVYASCLKHNEFPGIWNSLWIVLGFPVVPSLIVSNSLLPMDSTMSALPVLHHLFAQTHAHWVGDAIQPSSSSVVPFSSSLQSFPSSGSFPMSWLFSSGSQIIGASASVLPMNIQGWFPLGLTKVWSPCCPRDYQESSPTPQFKSINSMALSLLYGPTLSSIHDH